jgi:hypothetical protein
MIHLPAAIIIFRLFKIAGQIFSGSSVKNNKKSLRRIEGNIYMDGLVSTGNKFPYTILNIFFTN